MHRNTKNAYPRLFYVTQPFILDMKTEFSTE